MVRVRVLYLRDSLEVHSWLCWSPVENRRGKNCRNASYQNKRRRQLNNSSDTCTLENRFRVWDTFELGRHRCNLRKPIPKDRTPRSCQCHTWLLHHSKPVKRIKHTMVLLQLTGRQQIRVLLLVATPFFFTLSLHINKKPTNLITFITNIVSVSIHCIGSRVVEKFCTGTGNGDGSVQSFVLQPHQSLSLDVLKKFLYTLEKFGENCMPHGSLAYRTLRK